MKKVKKIQKKAMSKIPLMLAAVVILSLSYYQLFGATTSIMQRFLQKGSVVEAADTVLLKGLIPTHISIEKADINLPIVAVPLKNGTWKVNEGVANYAVGTSKISEEDGNVGIYGHDKTNAFSRIKKLTGGDVIKLTAGEYVATYTVLSKSLTVPSDVDTFYPTKKPILTLITCDGVFSDQRYVVKARLISIKKGIQE